MTCKYMHCILKYVKMCKIKLIFSRLRIHETKRLFFSSFVVNNTKKNMHLHKNFSHNYITLNIKFEEEHFFFCISISNFKCHYCHLLLNVFYMNHGGFCISLLIFINGLEEVYFKIFFCLF